MRQSMTLSPLVNAEMVSSVCFLQKQFVKNCLRQSAFQGGSKLFELIQRFDCIQMKYSITSDQSKLPPIALTGTFSRVFSNYNTTYAFSLVQNKLAKLYHFDFEKSEADQTISTLQNSEQYLVTSQIKWQRLRHMHQTEDQWILVLQAPFQLIFCLKKYKSFVPIVLDQQLSVQQMICYVTYPQMLCYGYSSQTKTNLMYTINLQTFQLKQITQNKQYSPARRTQFWSYFADNRLYVMGGICKNNEEPDQLLWTYNIENGYWFALEVNQPIGCHLNCEFQNGKVIAIGSQQIYVVELYQSRVSLLQGWREMISAERLKQVRGVYVFKDEIYLIGEQFVHPCLKIVKNKVSQV